MAKPLTVTTADVNEMIASALDKLRDSVREQPFDFFPHGITRIKFSVSIGKDNGLASVDFEASGPDTAGDRDDNFWGDDEE